MLIDRTFIKDSNHQKFDRDTLFFPLEGNFLQTT